jgi:antitoxin (DNA-binding transcriptional repressor) of toxin-antitoxin stability system
LRAGKPAARLVPINAKKPVRQLGALKGKLKIADDFDAPLPSDIQSAFEGD